MNQYFKSASEKVKNIKGEGLSIYDEIIAGDNRYWLLTEELEIILNAELRGKNVNGLALKTRSKVIKASICEALGYSKPKQFKRTQPRFLGQNFDVYGQKRKNLQVYNEEIYPTRRYVLINISNKDIIENVKVVNGQMLSNLDRTGTLTKKYQARLNIEGENSELISNEDTKRLRDIVVNNADLSKVLPTDNPDEYKLLSIESIYKSLLPIIGCEFKDTGKDQERNRGSELQKLVCEHLGYTVYKDNGQLPDIRHQLLEIKLQTSPTIDLGAFKPDSKEALDIPQLKNNTIRVRDIRYAIFYANIEDGYVKITNFYLTTGKKFFERFPQMQGKQVNKKIQITLPKDFFE